MAVSRFHFRSISFPSRLQSTNATRIEGKLQKLKSWQLTMSVPVKYMLHSIKCKIDKDPSFIYTHQNKYMWMNNICYNRYISPILPITSEAIQSSLVELTGLYNSTQFPATQQSIFILDHQHQDGEKSMNESLEFSVELLDSCNTIRELVQMIKENVQALKSALRRKGLDSSIQDDITTYSYFRTRMNKCIIKSLKTLKNLENKNTSSLSQVISLTILIFKCILWFLSWPTGRSGGRSFVSSLMLARSMACRRDENVIRTNGDVQMLQRKLHDFEGEVQGFEVGLERLFRELVRSRVAVLNIVTDHLK